MMPCAQVLADLPVHCVHHQISGKWRFTLGALSEKRSSCGHRHPDVDISQPARQVVDIAKAGHVFMTLSKPNVVDSSMGKGQWTMVYDEGFEVNLHNLSFFAFSNFTFTGPKKSNVSHCDQTMVGWYSTANRTHFGCYYGERETLPRRVALKDSMHKTTAGPNTHVKSIYDRPLDHETQRRHVAMLNKRLNMLQLGWRARVMPKW